MKLLLSLLLVMSANAADYNGHGYVYFGGNSYGRTAFAEWVSAGVGGEGFVYKGLAAGADIGYLFPAVSPTYGVGLLTVNGSYHFTTRTRERKLAPFVTAGWGLYFREGTLSTFNYGGGATYWFHRHLGVRAEVRDFRHPSYGRMDTTLRIGISFR